MPTLSIPDPSLVVLVGASGSGKSTFARTHFGRYESVSSDACRALVANDESDQGASGDAFDVLHFIAERRLRRGLLTVVDATSVQPGARRPLLALAHRAHLPAVAIVLDMPEETCLAWNAARPERQLQPETIHGQREGLHRAMHDLSREGFDVVHILRSPEELAATGIVRVPLPPNRTGDHGPFDIIGDIHGCADELESLLLLLGWRRDGHGIPRHGEGRRLVFLGDLVDRGPRTPDVLRDAMAMCAAGIAYAVPGNHDDKLRRKLLGREVTIANGLRESLEQLSQEPPEFLEEVASFLGSLPSHLVLDGGRLVVAHAGMKLPLQGRESRRVRDFALYGENTGEVDSHGLPVRLDWGASYRGEPHVVYGHTPVTIPLWVNRTINIDTGCVFGGRLTALRWPEGEIVSVPALREYAHPARPFVEPQASASPAASARVTR